MNKGKLYLIPVPIHNEEEFNSKFIPPYLTEEINKLNVFAVENIRTSRRFLRKINPKFNINDTTFHLIDKRTEEAEYSNIINCLINGNDVGVMSESGCPGIADPGQKLCSLAHHKNILIKPLIGPSSILLALMSSGLNGQRFTFHGYLPIEKEKRIKAIKKLHPNTGSHIFIETPYRNQKVYDDLIQNLKPDIRKLCIATDLTGLNESIFTKKISELKQSNIILKKYPTIFIFE